VDLHGAPTLLESLVSVVFVKPILATMKGVSIDA
jgi:hypothetical protein